MDGYPESARAKQDAQGAARWNHSPVAAAPAVSRRLCRRRPAFGHLPKADTAQCTTVCAASAAIREMEVTAVIVRALGSAAAEGMPGIFCVCDVCAEARRRGGREIRRRTAYMLGDEILIDFGPDIYNSMISFGLDYSRVRHILISHSHEDHWYPHELFFRRKGFSVIAEGSHITVHGNEAVGRRFHEVLTDTSACAVDFELARPFKEIDLAPGVTAVPVKANHAPEQTALNWLVRTPHGGVLFGNDTGWYPAETWDFLAGADLKVVFMDSTSGRMPYRDHHMGCEVVVEVRDMMAKIDAIDPAARFVAIHFSHNGGMLHTDLEDFYGPRGIETAYDGMEIDLSA